MALPKLVVFDLDFTLWDCGGRWIDHTSPPFRADANGTIRDREGRRFFLYPDVPDLLDDLESMGCVLGLASRTGEPAWAREVLELMGVRDRFDFEEIYPGSKVQHFRSLAGATGFSHHEMLFFDDEQRNIAEVSQLGVTSVHVANGVDRADLDEGLERHRGLSEQ